MKKGVLLLAGLILSGLQSVEILAQSQAMRDIYPMSREAGEPIVCYSTDVNMHTSVPFRRDLEALAGARGEGAEAAVFEVDYFGFTSAERAAFQYAVDIWSTLLVSDVPIRIEVAMRTDMPEGTLASTGWGGLNANFRNAQKINTWYVVALAEKMAGEELNDPGDPDIVMSFNGDRNFYTDLDANPPSGTFDMVTIALHEIAHGLGFFTHTFVDDGGLGQFGRAVGGIPTVYARAMENSDEENIFDVYNAQNPSALLGTQLTGDDLYFRSESFNALSLPRLFAPGEFNGGSSISHLDEASYPANDPNSLMTPQVGLAEAIHDPGLSLTMLQDMGWVNINIAHDALLDTEDAINARAITAVITGDNAVDASQVKLYYTYTNWENADTLDMIATGNLDEFEAFIPGPITDTPVSYFVTVNDVAGRAYSLPGEAPDFFNQYIVAPDTISPILFHQPLSVVFLDDPIVDVVALVGDNLGVEPLIMTYKINGGAPTDIEIPAVEVDQDGFYSALHLLEWDLSALNVVKGDIVEYKLRITDASAAANEAIHPSGEIGFNKIQVDELNNPEPFYLNDFNSPTEDFVGFGFQIGNLDGFSSGIMHSDHPYRSSPGSSPEDTLILFQMLKTPIIVSETADKINFDEVVLVEPGEPGSSFGDDDFWDYVVVEALTDLGVTWQPLGNGYDSRDYTDWEVHYNSDLVFEDFGGSQFPNSEAKGSESFFRPRELSILDASNIQPGDQVLIRFKIYADQLAVGWGWAIDNLKIQVDDEAPEISHIPTDYLAIGETGLEVTAKITDNTVLDSVTFEFEIDGTPVFANFDDQAEVYKVNLAIDAVTATSSIKYRIIAVDSAIVPNTAYLPELGFYEIPVAQLGEAKAIYTNDFNSASDDFIGVNFSVTDYEGFTSPAIHSRHPHPKAAIDSDTMSYLLKYPIQTSAGRAWMSFDEVVLINVNGDGVFIEVSNDNGANWYPVIEKYSSFENQDWFTEWNKKDFDGNSSGVGSAELYRSRLLDLLSPPEVSGGEELLVRFSMIVDDWLHSWGWVIDNLEIQDVTTGIEAIALTNIELYPNPAAQGRFRIKGQVEAPSVELSITDMTGKLMLRESWETNGEFDREYNLDGVKPGIYLVSLQTANGLSTTRLIIR